MFVHKVPEVLDGLVVAGTASLWLVVDKTSVGSPSRSFAVARYTAKRSRNMCVHTRLPFFVALSVTRSYALPSSLRLLAIRVGCATELAVQAAHRPNVDQRGHSSSSLRAWTCVECQYTVNHHTNNQPAIPFPYQHHYFLPRHVLVVPTSSLFLLLYLKVHLDKETILQTNSRNYDAKSS